MGNGKLGDSFRRSFNGIIFRQRQILEQLRLYDSINRLENTKDPRVKNANSVTINIKLLFQSFDGMAHMLLPEYMEQVQMKIQFAFIEKDYVYGGI